MKVWYAFYAAMVMYVITTSSNVPLFVCLFVVVIKSQL